MANEYRCPAAHVLRSDRREFRNPRTHITKVDTIVYRARQSDCKNFSMKNRCCPNTPTRKIARSIHEDARDVARRIATTPEYKQTCRERKKVEKLFAYLKRILKPDRLRIRRPTGAHNEFLLAATAQNLRRMRSDSRPNALEARSPLDREQRSGRSVRTGIFVNIHSRKSVRRKTIVTTKTRLFQTESEDEKPLSLLRRPTAQGRDRPVA